MGPYRTTCHTNAEISLYLCNRRSDKKSQMSKQVTIYQALKFMSMEKNNPTDRLPEDVKTLQRESKNLAHRVEVLENLLATAKEVLTLEEAAAFLGVKRSQLYKMTHKAAIPFYKPNGKMIYFERSELLAWLRNVKSASTKEIAEDAQRIVHENDSRQSVQVCG